MAVTPRILLLLALLIGVLAPRAARAGDGAVAVVVVAPLDGAYDAGDRVRVGKRKATGFALTALGALPVLLGAIVSVEAEPGDGSPLVATGVALGATGSALLLPWEKAIARGGRPRTIVRVTMGYKPGGVRIGVAGRF